MRQGKGLIARTSTALLAVTLTGWRESVTVADAPRLLFTITHPGRVQVCATVVAEAAEFDVEALGMDPNDDVVEAAPRVEIALERRGRIRAVVPLNRAESRARRSEARGAASSCQ
jgi:hypothetical protein